VVTPGAVAIGRPPTSPPPPRGLRLGGDQGCRDDEGGPAGIIHRAALTLCHGGQLTVFEALAGRSPVLVLPLQPEQAHNGLCLARLGCGRSLLPPRPFLGDSRTYVDAFATLPKEWTVDQIRQFQDYFDALMSGNSVGKRVVAASTTSAGCRPGRCQAKRPMALPPVPEPRTAWASIALGKGGGRPRARCHADRPWAARAVKSAAGKLPRATLRTKSKGK